MSENIEQATAAPGEKRRIEPVTVEDIDRWNDLIKQVNRLGIEHAIAVLAAADD